MKSILGEKSAFLRTATISHIAGRSHFDDLKERAMIAVAWSLGIAAVVALYAFMSVALYRWSVDSPIFPPDLGPGAARQEATPWQ